ncbi:MAG: hypothetical protein NT087_08380 [Deltaproteobacteria bacterium]|nr:hypothetical protein [Deltaproteobacteria bacterium]
MKVNIFVMGLLAIAMFLGWGLYAEKELSRQQQSHIAELTAKLNDKTASDNLELQGKCAQQAKSMFLQLGYKANAGDAYQSHYNAKLNKCLMEIYTSRFPTVARSLFDAYDQKPYANYFWIARKDKKFEDVPPSNCTFYPDTPSQRFCKSEDEYKAFAAEYME